MNRICVAGIGPGAPSYVTPAALDAVRECDILVGGKRNLEVFHYLGKKQYEFRSRPEELLEFFDQNTEKKICVIVSGDPGFYSLLDFLRRRLGSDRLDVIPGISSFQYLFARMAKPWKNFLLASMHGRDLDIKKNLEERGGLFLLTDRSHSPAVIAGYLLEQGLSDCTMVVGENLSYPEERIVTGRPKEIKGQQFNDLSVVVIERDGMEL